MPLSERYQRQVALLIAAMPFVATETDFALKGGTAINLFVRDMPRLSVDIDLTYLPLAGRSESLAVIDAAMSRMPVAACRRELRLQLSTRRASRSAVCAQRGIHRGGGPCRIPLQIPRR